MVRFEKFKIWHAQGSGADLSDIKMTCVMSVDLVTETKSGLTGLNLNLVAVPVARWIFVIFCMQICMGEPSTYSKNHYNRANTGGFRRFLVLPLAELFNIDPEILVIFLVHGLFLNSSHSNACCNSLSV